MNFSRSDSLVTLVRFSAPGTYYLGLDAYDGQNSTQDTIIIVLRPAPQIPGSLKDVEVPGPDKVAGFDYTRYVVNRDAAVQLGKAFFWDMQAGSDGIQACATCHYHAGADVRFKNTMSPGLLGIENKDLNETVVRIIHLNN